MPLEYWNVVGSLNKGPNLGNVVSVKSLSIGYCIGNHWRGLNKPFSCSVFHDKICLSDVGTSFREYSPNPTFIVIPIEFLRFAVL